jgi:hypothetical protein
MESRKHSEAFAIAIEIAGIQNSGISVNALSFLEPALLYALIESYDYQWDGSTWTGKYNADLPIAIVALVGVYEDGTVEFEITRPTGSRSSDSRFCRMRVGQQALIHATPYSKEHIVRDMENE